jgi:hypothetical protein
LSAASSEATVEMSVAESEASPVARPLRAERKGAVNDRQAVGQK